MVFNVDTEEKSPVLFSDEERRSITDTAEEIRRILSDAEEYAFNLTAESLPPVFRDNDRMRYFACINSRISRSVVFMQAIKDGWIRYDEDTSKVAGAYIYI